MYWRSPVGRAHRTPSKYLAHVRAEVGRIYQWDVAGEERSELDEKLLVDAHELFTALLAADDQRTVKKADRQIAALLTKMKVD